MKNILITGANGFIGKNVLEKLSEKFNFILASRVNGTDITDINSLRRIQADTIDAVLHLGALVHPKLSEDLRYDFYDFNINTTLNVAEFSRERGARHIIYANTYVYGRPQYMPIDEKHRVELLTPYHQSKYLAEQTLFEFFKNDNNTFVTSLRLFNLYGAYQSEEFMISKLLNAFKQKKGMLEVGSIGPKRDYLYINDLVELLGILLESNTRKSDYYNVGTGNSYAVNEITDILSGLSNSTLELKNSNHISNIEILDCKANIQKIAGEYGWKPKYSLLQGLEELYFNEKAR